MSVLGQIVDANTKNKFEENKELTDVYMYVDPTGFGAASVFDSKASGLRARRRFADGEADAVLQVQHTSGCVCGIKWIIV